MFYRRTASILYLPIVLKSIRNIADKWYMSLKEKFTKFLKSLGMGASPRVKALKSALRGTALCRDDGDKISEVIYDYPILVELCKAYIEEKDFETAQEIIRSCFQLRDQYANFGGNREALLIKHLAKDFISKGREDLAQKIMRKVKNFEHGIPTHLLSGTFFPDREFLKQELAKGSDENTQSPANQKNNLR